MLSRRSSTVAAMTALGVIYVAIGKLSLHLAFFQPSASPVWPPAGIALAALLLLGYRATAVIFVGAFLVNLTTAGNIVTSLCIAAGNSIEALCGAWLVRQFAGGVRVLERAQDLFKFFLIAIVATAVSASIGSTTLAVARLMPWPSYGAVWLTWWLGDLTGYLLVTPLILSWWRNPHWREERERNLELFGLLILLIGLAGTVFGNWFPGIATRYPIGFICGPIIIWTAYRFTQRETITAIVILSAIALQGALIKKGPYAYAGLNESLLLLQGWIATLTLTSMTLAAAMAERRRAEAALEEQNRIVEQANQTKDNFLAMLSHELRTPLTPVLALVDMLERDCGNDRAVREAGAVIRRNVLLESRLIDDLLDLTRIGQGKLNLDRKSMDAHEAITQAVEICRSEIAAKQLNLGLELTASNSHLLADPAKLQQIIWNLLKNAIKFTPPMGAIRIISHNEGSRTLVISVRDTGIGIEPELIERIFTPFEQGDESLQRRHGGLGLGLAISKSIAEAHGASLLAQSDGRGHGATFTLRITTVTSTDPTTTNEHRPEEVEERSLLRILLVDDHLDTCTALGSLLGRRGHVISTAHDLRSAIRLAGSHPFDLLISDVGLPDGNGAELMTHLRSKGTRGIAISGFGMEPDVRKSLAAGFSEHLVKPIDFAQLEAAIVRAMGKREVSASEPAT
jgi:signal transduction histidine kinase/ActR/RegA family two-component response regulator